MTNIDRALIRAFHGGSSHSAVPSLLRAQPVAERVVKFPRISATPVESDTATDEERSHVPAQSQYGAAAHDNSVLHEELISHREIVTPENLVAPERDSSYGWEVDRLAWPAVVKDLLQTAADAVEQFVYFLRENPGRRHVVAVTSCHHGEGRTTTACVLARQAAQLGIHVALVDADRANPGLATALGLLAPSGWTIWHEFPSMPWKNS
ncbi:MAG: hypothetical protein O2931_12980 [Planctomycetota bacterium]|nr:hypothetical protein [Planctomycetota bacterium]